MRRALPPAPGVVERLLLAHPRSVGESYAQHFGAALRFAALLASAAGACVVHAFVPGFFTRTASRRVAALNERMQRGRARLSARGAEPDWAI
ncbi:MAG TPA: DUF6356 family protein [Myxococcota bacterium]